jgi:putative ABC transport system permease protein
MEIVQGRDFSKGMGTDPAEAFIINEAAVHNLQLVDPLKTRFEWGDKKGRVIGVVKDFQFQSLKTEINPLVIHVFPAGTRIFAVRIQPVNIPETIAFLENKWKELDPEHPFTYHFMDDSFDRIYRSEEKLSRIFSIFSILAIFIAALGLFGLALFMVEQRTKEIGVRKVLGASVGNIFLLVSKDFAILVIFANLFAWPISYLLMRKWLQTFAYRISIQPWIFVLAAVIAFAIALLTISFQAVKAAVANPVDSLRYE